MEATIKSTKAIVSLADGVRARVWEGKTKKGVPFIAFIPLCMVLQTDDQAEFERDLESAHVEASADVMAAITHRFVRKHAH